MLARIELVMSVVGGGQCDPNHFTDLCSSFEAGLYLGLIDFVYHSTLGSRVIKKKKREGKVAGGGPGWRDQSIRGNVFSFQQLATKIATQVL